MTESLLTPDEARDADEVVAIVMEAAATQVSAEGCTADEAVRNHFAAVLERYPAAYNLAVARLRETGNDDMLRLAEEAALDV